MLCVETKQHSPEQAWEEKVDREVGRRVHRVIAEVVTGSAPAGPDDVLAAVSSMWLRDPLGGSVASSARLRTATSVCVYLARFRPERWELTGCEVRLDRSVADLVWRDPAASAVVVDEIKTGPAGAGDVRVADQLRRLATAGRARWGETFVGVRLVPLGSPARSALVDEAGAVVVAPVEMRPR